MPDPLAIRLDQVSKIYRLHGSQRDQLIDVLGLQRFGLNTRTPAKEFAALHDVSIEVPKGHRIGIVGRNGAGKTTLLKLICGNFSPTRGRIEVNGTVQALMNIGLGFHPDYTGRDNVAASLQYNGLSRDQYQAAMEGIIEFCELGDFLDQPFKTYSLGMQARLMFATATAIRPDILIVDEVLGAGDAYFIAKSKQRVERLVQSGCTMLLVSHSMQQVLELCDEAVWLDQGRIRMRGEAFLVVKAYEQYLHGPIAELASPLPQPATSPPGIKQPESADASDDTPAPPPADSASGAARTGIPDNLTLQEPRYLPHAATPTLPRVEPPEGFSFLAPGGLSRWDSKVGVKVMGFGIMTERGPTDRLVSMRPAKFLFTLVAERDGPFDCRYGIALHDHLGRCLTRIFSPRDAFEARAGERRVVEIVLNPCQIGPGDYTLGISVLEHEALEKLNSTPRYDLLSRSFALRVELPESLAALESAFFHTAEWSFLASAGEVSS